MAIDKYSRKATFDQVRYDIDAVKFHANKYSDGSVYPLAKSCFQLVQYLNSRNTYQKYLDDKEGTYGASYIKP